MSPDPHLKNRLTGQRSRRLGRGLSSLLANTKGAEHESGAQGAHGAKAMADSRYEHDGGEAVLVGRPGSLDVGPLEIAVDAIDPNPYQPRHEFDDAAFEELTESVRLHGVLQPLLVTRLPGTEQGRFTLVAGERRLRAAQNAGMETVPCAVRTAGRQQLLEWALIENVQRSDLGPLERATAYRDYMDRFSATQEQLAERLNQPRSTIANHLRLLDLCDDTQELLRTGALSFGHAKVLAGLAGNRRRQNQLAKMVDSRGMSVRQLEELIAAGQSGWGTDVETAEKKPTSEANGKSRHVLDVERQLSQAVGAKVSIRPSKRKNRGRIVIEYCSLDDFDRISEALGARIES